MTLRIGFNVFNHCPCLTCSTTTPLALFRCREMMTESFCCLLASELRFFVRNVITTWERTFQQGAGNINHDRKARFLYRSDIKILNSAALIGNILYVFNHSNANIESGAGKKTR